MLKLGPLDLDGSVPLVAVPFGAPPPMERLDEAKREGLDIAELRIDLYDSTAESSVLASTTEFAGVPMLATIRSKDEGGTWDAGEDRRLRLIEVLAPHVDAVDIELGSARSEEAIHLVHSAGRLALVSCHDFVKTPPLDTLLAHTDRAAALGADVVKIATHAADDRDVRTLASLLLARPEVPLVVIAMGSHGAKSRLFFPALGSLITFASLETTTAPGQLSLRDTVQALRAFYPKYDEKRRRRGS